MDKSLNNIKHYLETHQNLGGTSELAYINDQVCNILNASNIEEDGYTNNGQEVKNYITSGIPKQEWTPSMKRAIGKINSNNENSLWTAWYDGQTHVEITEPSDLVEDIDDFLSNQKEE